MSCEKCEEKQESGMVAYYRWKTANIAMIGCEFHLREVFDVLNGHQFPTTKEDKNGD